MFSLVSFANLGLALAQVQMFILDTPQNKPQEEITPLVHTSNIESTLDLTSNTINNSEGPQVHATFLHPFLNSIPEYECFFSIFPDYSKTNLTFINFPINQTLEFYTRRKLLPKGDTYNFELSFSILEDGSFQSKSKSIQKITMNALGFLPGERIEIKFLGIDSPFCHEISLIPNRLVAENGQFSVEAELLSFLPVTTYLITFDGLEEEENLTLKSITGSEIIEFELSCHGKYEMVHMPGISTRKGGNNLFEVTRKDGTKATLTLPWGIQIINYHKQCEDNYRNAAMKNA